MNNELDYSKQRTVFSLNAPTDADAVCVRIYSCMEASEPERTVWLAWVSTDSWVGSVEGDLLGKFYTFEVFPRGCGGHGLGECPGVFARAVGVNGRRAAIIDMAGTNPAGWAEDVRPVVGSPSDLVVYELHHRDFSVHPSGGYEHRGKYLALTEPKALFYLKSLGVGAVELLPSFDFATVDEAHPEWPQYNWGYDPQNYNVPEGSYSTDARRPDVRIREFKQMVMALHGAGIRVILDVVYNHCYSVADSNFQRTYPDGYFRRTSDGQLSNGSGCGNETASEQWLMRRFMVESVCWWATEYHVDGFRFDLMGLHDVETMNSIRKALDAIDPSITMHGEPWTAGPAALDSGLSANKEHICQMPSIGAFGNELRDALLGDHPAATWLAGSADAAERVKFGIVGGIRHPQVDAQRASYCGEPWAVQPSQHVSYVSCHDGLCLADHLRAAFPRLNQQRLVRLNKLAQTCVLLSQGVPFLYAGEEVFRSKQGNRNSYNAPDEVNQIDWTGLQRWPDLFLYYRGLIQLRREHRAFRMGSAEAVRRHLRFLPAPSGVVAFHLDGEAVGDAWHDIYVVLNPCRYTKKVTLPPARYTVVCKDGKVNLQGMATHRGGILRVAPQQAVVLYH
ncbi:MAG: type I pullulanase [Bacteroidaceae bacterium]|nr:type I pullulanase [Bacteroidaceae bacterium]